MTPENAVKIRKFVQDEYGMNITNAQGWCAGRAMVGLRAWQYYETGKRTMRASAEKCLMNAVEKLGDEK
jgi:hypothetical protein